MHVPHWRDIDGPGSGGVGDCIRVIDCVQPLPHGKPTDKWKIELTISVALRGTSGNYSVIIMTINEKAEIEWTSNEASLTAVNITDTDAAEIEIRKTRRS